MERTVTFTMEDALISPLGFSILSGAGLFKAGESGAKINVHMTSQVAVTASSGTVTVNLSEVIPANGKLVETAGMSYGFVLGDDGSIKTKLGKGTASQLGKTITFSETGLNNDSVVVLVDYYVEMSSGAQQIEVTPDKFAGNYYLEASTLFRRQSDGVDLPAQFIIPNVKIQSAFTFSMASSGDPSTFTFTADAFPDYTKFDRTRKVLFALQIVEDFQASPGRMLELE